MRLTGLSFAVLFAVLFAATPAAFAAIELNGNVTPNILFGEGNANGGFYIDRDNGIELGLRAKQRFPAANIFNNNNDGTFSFATGIGTGGPGTPAFPRPLWNFEWSINTDYLDSGSGVLNGFTYELRIDFDPTAGTNNFQTFDPINVAFADHGIGDNSTPNGDGDDDIPGRTAGDYSFLIANNNVAQNSWTMTFFDDATHVFDPNIDGTYTIQLAAYSRETNPTLLASASIDVIVGAGGAAIPEPLSFLAWGGLIGCALVASRRHLRS